VKGLVDFVVANIPLDWLTTNGSRPGLPEAGKSGWAMSR
jgi:hypothetical protein